MDQNNRQPLVDGQGNPVDVIEGTDAPVFSVEGMGLAGFNRQCCRQTRTMGESIRSGVGDLFPVRRRSDEGND